MSERKKAAKRYDSSHIVLRNKEYQRKDGMYLYKYKDSMGKSRIVYSKTLAGLREKEKEIARDLDDGIKTRYESAITVNEMFERYMKGKTELKDTTRSNYLYLYGKYVSEEFGKEKIANVKYSHVRTFYISMIKEKGFKLSSLEIIHTILHSVFVLAMRDDFIRKNPTDGVLTEIKKDYKWQKPKRHALTEEEQNAFISYVAGSKVYRRWLPLFTTLLGTGCRIGEVIGLTWQDCDFENNLIHINHNLVYRQKENGKCSFRIGTPKTEAGKRIIPMLEEVKQTLLELKKEQDRQGQQMTEIDGYTGFIFTNRRGYVHNPSTINRSIIRITNSYNEEEREKADREGREPLLIPHFSVHNLRHTFCSRFCENETNIKVIQEIMGHSDIGTTMNVYAEVTEKKKQDSFKNLEGKFKIC